MIIRSSLSIVLGLISMSHALLEVPDQELIITDKGDIIDTSKISEANAFYEVANELELLDREDPWYASHYNELTEGIGVILENSMKESPISLFSEKAFPVWLGEQGDVRIGAAEYGQGRVVASANVNWFSSTYTDSMTAFAQNAVKWLSNGKSSPVLASKTLKKVAGHDSMATSQDLTNLAGVDILFVDGRSPISDEEVGSVLQFVENGGSLLTGGHAVNYGNPIIQLPLNRIGSHIGYMVQGSNKLKNNPLPVLPIPAPERNLWNALQTMKADPTNPIASNTVSRTGNIPLKAEYINLAQFENLFQLGKEALSALSQSPSSSEAFCVLSKKIYPLLLAENPVDLNAFKKAPDLATFPYDIEDHATFLDKTVEIDGTTKSYSKNFMAANAASDFWMSTGLYVAAGTVVKVTIPYVLKKDGLGVVVGAHSDKLWKKDIKLRSPEIIRKFPLEQPTTKIASPYGGFLYISVPQNKNLNKFDVHVENVITAPYFILGETSDEDWINQVAQTASPWAELEAPGNVIHTIPVSYAKTVTNPTELMTLWNNLFTVTNRLAAFENGTRPRAERLAYDIQISAGAMHSGYPFGAQLSNLNKGTIYVDKIRENGLWGPFHEIGHNHQWRQWTIPATTETGCNWWALHLSEYLGTEPHGAVKNRIAAIHAWVMAGKPWSSYSVFLPLHTYAFLAEEFGWEESYSPVIKKYYGLKGLKFANDMEELDFWARNYIEQVGFDLCYYYQWWGWQLEEETLTLCNQLPPYSKNLIERFNHPTEHGSCPEGWLPYGESCFYLSSEKANWYDAEKMCAQGEGGHLAGCISEAELHYLSSQTQLDSYWIGASDLYEANKFAYLSGETFNGYDLWKSSYPKSDDTNNCVLLENGKLIDYGCLKKAKFICKTNSKNSCDINLSMYSCPDGWVYFRGRCYKFTDEKLTFEASKTKCSSEGTGGRLIEIDSIEEQNFFETGYKGLTWIGLTHNNGQDINWNSGNPVTFSNWCEGYPRQISNALVAASKFLKGCWKDYGKASKNALYVCEMPMTPA